MSRVIADRFMRAGAAWIDLASGAAVRVRLAAGGTAVEQFAWSDRCAALSLLRHPLLNVLVDYGAADAHHSFEAFTAERPVAASGRVAGELLTHVTRFLEARALPLDVSVAGLAVRQVAGRGVRATGRPLGITLQPRAVLTHLLEALAAAAPGGVARVEIAGEEGSGLRTARLLAARLARLEGFVPVSGSVVARCPWIVRLLDDRHVCVLVEEDAGDRERAAVAALLGALGIRSTRRHVLLGFRRGTPEHPRGLRVDPLGTIAMTSMVYVDRNCGPTEEEVMYAARYSRGNPARFLRELHALPFERHAGPVMVVHESLAPYVVDQPAAPSSSGMKSRRGRTLSGAGERAARLAARGRHASAIRLLMRAARVLEGRGEVETAAECAVQLGWLLRDRGRSDKAVEQFERARRLGERRSPATSQSAAALVALIGLGVVRTDHQRFTEGEAILRSAWAAAELTGDPGSVWTVLALGRCLFWQRRHDEGLVLLHQLHFDERPDARLHARVLAARLHAARGDLRSAVAAAGEALQCAGAQGSRATATAAKGMAIVQHALGDRAAAAAYAREGLAAATEAHLPLAGLQLRALLLRALAESETSLERARLLAQLRSALAHRDLPPLLEAQLEEACRTPAGPPLVEEPQVAPDRTLSDLQRLLEIAHAAPDDRTALEAVCRTVCERLAAATVLLVCATPERRVFAQVGRPWPSHAALCERVLATGRVLPAQCASEPHQAGEIVTYGGEPVGLMLCRWAPCGLFEDTIAAAMLRAGALAAAPCVRSVLDRAQAQPPEPAWGDLIGTSPAAAALREAVARAARAPFPVLVEGESGTGKELVARAIHRLGPRRERRLCAVNCAALSEDLLEAELFGHTRGAFTGAAGERAGLFEEADGGTLFLDEVAELSPRAQAKLLRVLQDGEVRRVGENLPRRVDARIVAATNRRLEEDAESGRFRADLRFRLDVIRISVPALRDRPTDIPALTAHFWSEAARRVGSHATLAPETVATLTRYEWPGNVRQLQNVIASLAVHAPRRGRVSPAVLPAHMARSAGPADATFEAAREEFERRFVRAALARSGGQRARTARALGVTRQGLAKMLRRLRIDA